jgi:hypothetical protein
MNDEAPAAPPHLEMKRGPIVTALSLWLQAYRVELLLGLCSFAVLAMFSSQRFLRQSAAPHFVYQAQAWLEGHQDLAPEVLPNFEDWACVRRVENEAQRCTRPLQPGDRWYSSFPPFPALLMVPFVALHGYQFNDTSFGVVIGALSVALFFSLLRLLREQEGTGRAPLEDAALALLLGFGTLFFYAAIRGEVWFSAEVLGVGLTAIYLRSAVGARRPLLAGLFWSMAVLTRTPLLFTGLFFLLEAIVPIKGQRWADLRAFAGAPFRPAHAATRRRLWQFAAGAAPLGLLAAASNLTRFGSPLEFGHRFFFENRVNQDIDTFGLFHLHYLTRNLDASFLQLPRFSLTPPSLTYSPWGLSLFLTFPLLAVLFVPPSRPKLANRAAGVMLAVLAASVWLPELASLPGAPPVGARPGLLWLLLAGALGFLGHNAWRWATEAHAPRLLVPLLLTLAACVLPGLLYQNTGYAQFGFRFSIDYTPYLVVLLAVGGWSLKRALPLALALLGVAVNFWGAVGFRGYTELVRSWP